MTTWISTMFHQGGASMFSILYLGVPAVLMALFHAIRPRRWSFWTAAGVTALVLVIALLGWRGSRSQVDDFLEREANDPEARTSPADRERIREEGYLEASRPLQFGGIVVGNCALPLLVGELRRRRSR
jgi:hypothetical protein